MSSRSTSPDPLTLPSSPLAAHSARARSSPLKPLIPRPLPPTSPSKSFLLDPGHTSHGGDGVSPWRIRVTVEAAADPQQRSPSRMQTVPLKGLGGEGSPLRKPPRRRPTPAKRRRRDDEVGEELEGAVKRPARTRQGTPVRRRRGGAGASTSGSDGPTGVAAGGDMEGGKQGAHHLMPPRTTLPPSSASRPSSSSASARRRRSLQQLRLRPDGTWRSQRLSQAREELDEALAEALGYEDEEEGGGMEDGGGEENTVSLNEDFTMVSVETLESLKGGGAGESSMVSLRGRGAERSAVSVSYLPSSPPEGRGGAVEEEEEEEEGEEEEEEEDEDYDSAHHLQQQQQQHNETDVGVTYPDLSDAATPAKSPSAPTQTAPHDPMSWKPTGLSAQAASPLPQTRHPRDRSHVESTRALDSDEPTVWRRRRAAVSRQVREANPIRAVVGQDATQLQEEEKEEEEEEEGREAEGEEGEKGEGRREQEYSLSPSPSPSPDQYGNEPQQAEPDARLGAQQNDEDDIWYEEASRSLEDAEAEAEAEGEADGDEDGNRAGEADPRPPPHHRFSSSTRHRLHDSGAGPGQQDTTELSGTEPPAKPPRGKIPRTWRRSSGMDFLYSDSPARDSRDGDEGAAGWGVAAGADADAGGVGQRGRREHGGRAVELRGEVDKGVGEGVGGGKGRKEGSTDRSSGVLTPPSSGEEEEEEHLSGRQGRQKGTGAGGARDESDGPKAEEEEEEEEEEEAGEETFDHPDGAATGLRDEDASAAVPTPETETDDTGLFWQSHVPHVLRRPQQRSRPRFRPQQRQRAMDLSELLGLEGSSSPAKPSLSVAERGEGVEGRTGEGVKRSRLRMQPVQGRVGLRSGSSGDGGGAGGAGTKVVESPLRRSLLRSSRMMVDGGGGRAVEKDIRRSESSLMDGARDGGVWGEGPGGTEEEGDAGESFESKTSDQRQLLHEAHARGRPSRFQPSALRRSNVAPSSARDSTEPYFARHETAHTNEVEKDEHTGSDEDVSMGSPTQHTEPSAFHSYEEHLNLDSPTKVRVKFNDSSQQVTGNSSLLAPQGEIVPLFPAAAAGSSSSSSSAAAPPGHPRSLWHENRLEADKTKTTTRHSQSLRPESPRTVTPTGTNPLPIPPAPQHHPTFLTKLTTTLWSTLLRPTGPPEILPTPPPPPTSSATAEQQPKAGGEDPSIPSSNFLATASRPTPSDPTPTTLHSARLRARYGVLPASHPWTLAHMRTLHRMLNSVRTRASSDTLILPPATTTSSSSSSLLPPHLTALIGTTQTSINGHPYLFTSAHAAVVQAFLQTLVPRAVVEAMERGEVAELGDGRARELRGWFGGRWGGERVWRDLLGEEDQGRGDGEGGIEVGFVVRALGDCGVVG